MIEARRNERGFWYVRLESGPHGHKGIRLWLSRPFVPPPRCPLEGTLVEASKAPFAQKWRHECPRCGRSLSDTYSKEPMAPVVHPEYPVRDFRFPVYGASVRRTERGSLVLVPGEGVVYLATVASGFRGSARIDEIKGGRTIATGEWYHSPQGNLGETAWALVQAGRDETIEVIGFREGRRISESERHVHFRLLPDGSTEEVLDPEAEDLLEPDELK